MGETDETPVDILLIEKDILFSKMVIGAIEHVKMPMLMYDEEKEVVKKALTKYIDELESKLRGR